MKDPVDSLAAATIRLTQASYLHGRTAALAEVTELLREDELADIPLSRERVLAALIVVASRDKIPEQLQ